MDALSSIFTWLSDHEAGISAVVGIAVLTGIVLAGVRSLVLRRTATAREKAPTASPEPASAEEASAPDLDPLTVPGFEGRPAIAVLPFDDLSSEHDQEYFADGIAEDLITRLSHQRVFPVIARNSSFTYKGRSVDVKQVGRELGVRYVVEGSVRKIGDQLRISAQLIDATTDAHVWAETYDRRLSDIFAVQDEISEAIAGAMNPELFRIEQARAARKEPRNLDAWDCVMRAGWHLNRSTKEDNAEARSLAERAVELDPQFAGALHLLAMAHLRAVWFQWTDSPAQSVAHLYQAARSSIELDPNDAFGQVALAAAHLFTGQQEEVIAACERSIEQNPSLPGAYLFLGGALAALCRSDDALDTLDKGMRLSPRDPSMWLFFWLVGMAHFSAERYEEAVQWSKRSLRGNPKWPATWRILAAAHAHLGQVDDARNAFAQMLRLQPGYSVSTARLTYATADPDYLDRYLDGLRKAGLKE